MKAGHPHPRPPCHSMPTSSTADLGDQPADVDERCMFCSGDGDPRCHQGGPLLPGTDAHLAASLCLPGWLSKSSLPVLPTTNSRKQPCRPSLTCLHAGGGAPRMGSWHTLTQHEPHEPAVNRGGPGLLAAHSHAHTHAVLCTATHCTSATALPCLPAAAVGRPGLSAQLQKRRLDLPQPVLPEPYQGGVARPGRCPHAGCLLVYERHTPSRVPVSPMLYHLCQRPASPEMLPCVPGSAAGSSSSSLWGMHARGRKEGKQAASSAVCV